jgi:hypothetical protein
VTTYWTAYVGFVYRRTCLAATRPQRDRSRLDVFGKGDVGQSRGHRQDAAVRRVFGLFPERRVLTEGESDPLRTGRLPHRQEDTGTVPKGTRAERSLYRNTERFGGMAKIHTGTIDWQRIADFSRKND